MRWSVDMQQFREVSRTRTIFSTETHTIVSDGADFLGEVIRKDIRKVVKC